MRPVVIFSLLLFSFSSTAQNQKSTTDIFHKMMHAMASVRTCKYNLTLEERIYGKMVKGQLQVKMQARPYKAYVYSIEPDKGAEVLLIEGENNGKALINPNKFPYINISLSPYHPLLRKNHQYTANQMGFEYLHTILKEYEAREKDNLYRKMKLTEEANHYLLEIDNNEFGFMNYKVQKGENVTDIAKKFFVNDQMILELNKEIKYFNDVAQGQVITIPNSFAKKITFYIDKINFLPLTQVIYDHKGLYSRITFGSFKLNPEIKPEEFTRDYKDYKF